MEKQWKNKMMGKVNLCFFIAAFSLFITADSYSQGAAINTTGASANPSAMLDVSGTSSGVLINRMTEAQKNAIVSPANGLLIYQTDNTSGFWYFNGTIWVQAIGPQGPMGANGATGPTGPAGSGGTPCTVAPPTPDAISGNLAVCTGGIGTYFVAPVTDATSYTWSYSGTGATVSGTTNIVGISFSSSATSGNLSVTATNACGTSAGSANFAVTVNGTPVSTFTVSPSNFYPGQTGVTFTPTVTDNQLYFWQTPDPAVQSSAMSPTFTLGPTFGNIALTVTKSGCNSTTVMSETPNSQLFNYTGSQQTFTVPLGVTLITMMAYGAQGANNTAAAGGDGGYAKGNLIVTPGQTLHVYAGGQNGYNGGGAPGAGGSYPGVNGGGASDVRVGGINLTDRVIVAGGGGGGGNSGQSWSAYAGGAGGGTIGGDGVGCCGNTPTGGTQSSGGSAGSDGGECGFSGTPGISGVGGTGGNPCHAYGTGSGGGGGYYGGGGGGSYGSGGSGGGGSSYIGGVTNALTSSGIQSGDGKVIITW